jgi:CDP-6-deoxy-D-xylo-4-hexulose-3-dehydrase
MRTIAQRHELKPGALAKTHDVDFARCYFGEEERRAVRAVMAGHWLASGRQNEAFEREFADLIGVPHALCVNSGSSANLIALAALDLPKGSKVLTSGCGFPATLSPILHLGLEPVLIDYDAETFNIDLRQAEDAMPHVDAMILAHTMGNPVDMARLMTAADACGVPVIEDCCEAIGAKLHGEQVGSYGQIGTFSFYPSHQITALGGGGMVTFKSDEHYARAKSLRDWGKAGDGYGRNNTTYSASVGGIPYFPHYVYSTVGWNFKLPEANAAFGREQLRRLDWIVGQRKRNHWRILHALAEVDRRRLHPVHVVAGADPSWFGVILCPTTCTGRALGDALEARGVRHRPFFAGNITRHEPFKRYAADLPIADHLMKQAIFVGCYAGLTDEQCEYIAKSIGEALDAAL